MFNLAPASTPEATLLQRYARHCNIPMQSDSASLQLLIDDRYQLQLQALPSEGIMIRGLLKLLPAEGQERDDLLLTFALLACGTMKEHATTCSIDAREQAIWLQLPALVQSVSDVDEAVGTFVNSFAFWTKVCAAL